MLSLNPLPEEVAHAKTIVLFGLGREAHSTYTFLKNYASLSQVGSAPDFSFVLMDDQQLEQISPVWKEVADQESVTFVGSVVPDVDPASTLLFVSPGIPPTHSILAQLLQRNIPHTSNTDLALKLLPKNVHTIGITGTKGKSTTSALIHHVLTVGKTPTFLGGNIGTAPLDVVAQIAHSPEVAHETSAATLAAIAVLELSSHQLRTTTVSPQIAVILDITPEHLDYYHTFEEYQSAKAKIVAHQTANDIVVFNPDHETAAAIAATSAGKKLEFTTHPPLSPTSDDYPVVAYLHENKLMYGSETILEDTDQMQIIGNHNRENALPSVVIAKEYGLENQQIATALLNFTGLPHRLQFVAEDRGVWYINDSLSTTPEAAVAALQTFNDSSVVLIAGGHDRHLDFGPLARQILAQSVTALITFPPTGEQITRALYQMQPNSPLLQEAGFKVNSMSEAVSIAKKMARPGDVVLLSPGSASFGLFEDYADRGEQFVNAVTDHSDAQ